ncbi:hypothetical protein QQF64_006322 [Cirrhinus molitorella]|uniref:RNA helicase n=1 Tax=Cirrhinus molitorella TaxID=172907 RepID=A0ABR3MIR0_9TELE
MSICSTPSKMQSNILAEADDSVHMEDVDNLLNQLKKKKKKSKDKRMAEADEIDSPAPKKRKAEKMLIESVDMNGNTDTNQMKVKNKKKALVENVMVNGGTDKTYLPAIVDTPAPSSEDSDSEREKETPEQKEGAFSNFRISQNTIDLLQARGVKYLFDIQAKTFDPVYDGKDVIGQARTGTGKTFSFAIPLVEKLQSETDERCRGRAPKVLVLAPTRELAIQVSKDFKAITRKLSVTCFYGGSSYNPQVEAIRNGIDVLVGTPGRIKDHLDNNKLDLSQLKHVVLDEVDQMLDLGFADQVEEILSLSYTKEAEERPQTLLFSATCPSWVYNMAKKYMRSQCIHVDLIGKKTKRTATTVEHLAIACPWSQRASVIGDVIQVYSGSHGRTIVFCETKAEASALSLNTSIKQNAQVLHGDIVQKQREITLNGFRNGTFEVLVATNVAARGLDIPEVDLVIQCSPPKDVESYIHRSGRTGRAGRTGVCICFYQRREENQLIFVEHKAGITFKRIGVPSTSDVIQSSSKDAIRFLDSVPEEVNRSLLNSEPGHTTMIMNCSQEMHSVGLGLRELKEQLGEEIRDQVKQMTFLKGKMGVCFDVPVNKVKEIQDQWKDGRRWQLSVATELPELEQSMRQSGERGFRGRSGGRGGGRGGGRSFGRDGGRSGGRGGGRGRRSFGFKGSNSFGGRKEQGGPQKSNSRLTFDY